jgi:hypothetical protein
MKNLRFVLDFEPVMRFEVEGVEDCESDGVSVHNGEVRIALCCAENADEDLDKVIKKSLDLFKSKSGKEIYFKYTSDLLPNHNEDEYEK